MARDSWNYQPPAIHEWLKTPLSLMVTLDKQKQSMEQLWEFVENWRYMIPCCCSPVAEQSVDLFNLRENCRRQYEEVRELLPLELVVRLNVVLDEHFNYKRQTWAEIAHAQSLVNGVSSLMTDLAWCLPQGDMLDLLLDRYRKMTRWHGKFHETYSLETRNRKTGERMEGWVNYQEPDPVYPQPMDQDPVEAPGGSNQARI